MEPEARTTEEASRKYAWDYFTIHAAQRLSAFQFFITLSTAFVGGFLLLLKGSDLQRWMAIIGLMLTFTAFTFFKLDERTRMLVKNGEGALRYLDSLHARPADGALPHALCLFDRDDALRQQDPTRWMFLGTYSYTRCFRSVFLCFGVLGLVAAGYCLALGK